MTPSIVDPNTEIDYEVKSTWYQLIEAGKQKNYEQLLNVSMDTISACNKRMLLRQFIKNCSSELLSELFFNRIRDTSKILVQNNEVISSYYSAYFLSKLKVYGETFTIKRVQVDLKDTEPYIVAFDFVETRNGFKFFSCDVYGGPQCCR
ncbi:MAG: hypothetical protein ABIN01_15680 [Ferruginibacter sp.]